MDDKFKNLGFRDFTTVDYAQMNDELIAYRRKRLKNGAMHEDMDAQQQRKAGQRMKRLAPRIQVAKKKAMKKAASGDAIDKRARQQARAELGKKFSGGKSKSDQSFAQRRQVNKKLSNQKDRIDALAKRKRTQVRTMDRERRASANKAD